jgi:uncharacterized protein
VIVLSAFFSGRTARRSDTVLVSDGFAVSIFLLAQLKLLCYCMVVMGIDEIIKTKRDEIVRIAEKHGAYNVRVFGSVARGEAGPSSDVDILVEVGKQHSSFFPGGLIADLEDLLGRRVDVVTVKGLSHLLRDRVLKEAVAI